MDVGKRVGKNPLHRGLSVTYNKTVIINDFKTEHMRLNYAE